MSSKEAILLVGGTGFIGRALAARLLAAGREVHVLGRRPAIGSGQGVTLSELISFVERVTEKRLPIDKQAARPSDVGRIVLDSTQAMECLAWSPRIGLEEGIKKTWQSLV